MRSSFTSPSVWGSRRRSSAVAVLFACFGKFSLTLGKLALQSVMSCSGLVNVLSGLALSRLLGPILQADHTVIDVGHHRDVGHQ
jgi:hypothetical protein